MSGRARLCLCLAGPSLAEDRRLLEEYRGLVDLAELRADFLPRAEMAPAAALPRSAGVPMILTVRRRVDGGEFAGSEADRVALLSRLSTGGFAWVDLEEDLQAPGLEAAVAAAGSNVIRSFHDFAGVPGGLSNRVRRLARRARELPKAAVMVRGTGDLARLLDACRDLAGIEKVILGMGEHGFCTRVLASRLGSSICYASAPGAIVAPGQADPRTLAELYRFASVGPSTSVYGVVGSPVSHSLSPLIHNGGFAALGLDAVYLPFPVDDIEAFRPAAEALGVRGFSVTHPHKQAVIPLLEQRDGLVQATGACNTVIVTPGAAGSGPGWSGTNTDVEGFLAPLRRCLGGTIPRGLKATVVGAGGAARAVVHALASSGAEVLVLNRNAERARELARHFPVEVGTLDGEGALRAAGYSDLIVQATSAGMTAGGGDPFPEYRFRGHEVVYELVYAPPVTRFLERAMQAGCRILQGRAMLLAQAREQFRLFTGMDLPEAAAQIEN